MGRAKKKLKQEFSFPSASESVSSVPASSVENLQEKKEIKKAIDDLPEIFTPEQVAWVFDVYSGALSFVFSLVLKTDFKAIHEELKFEEREKVALSKPLARICSKYCPVEWAGMQAEMELIGSIGMYTVMGFRRAQGVAEKEKEKKRMETEKKTVAMRQPQSQPAAAVTV